MTAAKITTAAKIVSTACKVVSNAATFTQAAIGGVNNAKAIVKNMINGKLFSEDTAKNLVSFGINAFTAATSGKNLLSSSKELKKVVGDSVGSKWGKKAKKEPLLEYNLQFFADKSGSKTTVPNPNGKKGGVAHQNTIKLIENTNVNGKIQYERKYDTPNGYKQKRYADAVEIVNGEVTKIHQVGKVNKNGTPIIRESKAIEDIMSSIDYNGAPVYFWPYNNSHTEPIIFEY